MPSSSNSENHHDQNQTVDGVRTVVALSAGSTFTLTLKHPTYPANSPSARPTTSSSDAEAKLRPLPRLTYDGKAQYTLVKPLQSQPIRPGCRWQRAQVWIAAPFEEHTPAILSPTTAVVFKIVPLVYDVLGEKGEVAVYTSLAWLQGRALPYFFGVSEVLMPWDEPVWLMAFEWIPGPTFEKIIDLMHADCDTKYRRDVVLYKDLFRSALDALQHAHKHDIIHRDLYPRNILIDEDNNQAVLIDWRSYGEISPDRYPIWQDEDRCRLLQAFTVHPHVKDVYLLCHELGAICAVLPSLDEIHEMWAVSAQADTEH